MTLLDIHVGRPVTRAGLSLFPLWNGGAVTTRGYDLGAGTLSVAERSGGAVVEELVVTNTGRRPALVLEGELLLGGQQHRVAATSAMVDAGAGQVLPVRCVEEGRWSGGNEHTRSLRHAPLSIRTAQDQYRTWQRVRGMEARYGGGATHFLDDALRPAEDDIRRLVEGLRPLPFQSGLLIGLGGQVLQAELYDSPRTLAAVWTSLLQAAGTDALAAAPMPTPGRRARRFVERMRHASEHGGTEKVRFSSLTWRDRTVHAVGVDPRHELVRT